MNEKLIIEPQNTEKNAEFCAAVLSVKFCVFRGLHLELSPPWIKMPAEGFTMPDQADNMVELNRYMNRDQAELARERLLEAGITASIPDDLLYNVHAGVSGASGGVRLIVEGKDAEEAKQILEKSIDEYPLPPDFDPSTPVDETPVETGRKLPFGATFMTGGIAALVLLALWTAFMAPGAMVVIGRILWNVVLVFLIGGLFALVIHVCARALVNKNPDKKEE